MYLSDGINVPATECEAVCFMTKDNSIIARQKKKKPSFFEMIKQNVFLVNTYSWLQVVFLLVLPG